MKIYHLDALDTNISLPASALTIGNFDGVHLGHQAMLAKLKAIAQPQQLATMVMIFEPQPREYFAKLNGNPNNAPARLTTLMEKQMRLAESGVDFLVIARFDDAFRSLSATQFADILVQRLNVKALVLGDDFRFGHDRTGDSEFLRQYGLAVTNLHTVTDQSSHASHTNNSELNTEQARISSTRIRQCLHQGDLATANRLLGYDYNMTGEVISGDQIGRTLHYPTANISLNRINPALHGIYGVDVVMLDENNQVIKSGFDQAALSPELTGISGLREHSLFGAANIGVRPAINQSHEWRLEVHFPNFSGDLYHKRLNVRFLHFLHAEKNYPNLTALQAGIQSDVQALLAWRQQQLK
ncbi:riboflavin biosynthesis protein RibF [Psychrobacter sp. I-STPA6b]|uniref:riboflavin biosynthesis protein RibF n=1 Tax=Psychrobacter sp. I-STPA6b TaxID=2585718 RepID=UPI001D0C68B3|nr:riboflavin biosynthesis protein RibF [Psychrobacter sp. I-STPA6b]